MKDSEVKAQLAQTRKGKLGGTAAAYANDSGITTPIAGDNEAPFVKANPFVTETETYWQELPLAPAGDYVVGPTIDVARWRVLVIYLVGDIGGDTGLLSLLPEGSAAIDDVDEPYHPVGVINPTITPVTVDSDTAYGSRTMYQTELRSPVGGIVTTLAFDVTPYSGFRFRAAALDVGEGSGSITLKYALSM